MSDEPSIEFVQPPTLQNGPILLAEPDPNWPTAYAEQEACIRSSLGDRAVRVEHVGSTSVPALAAKPILDILLLVSDPTAEHDYVPALERNGYQLHHREPGWYEHRLLKRTDPAVNLHVFGRDCPEAERMLLFRDWLHSDAVDRELHERTKRELAQHEWKYVQRSADAKSAVVEEVITRAQAARRQTSNRLVLSG